MRRAPNKVVPAIDARLLRGWPLPQPEHGDKERRGRVLVIGGARQMPGAVILAATAALRAGAGKLQIATVASVSPHVATAMPESLVHAVAETPAGGFARSAASTLAAACKAVQSIVIGPGMLENAALAPLVLGTLEQLTEGQTVVLDAGALTAMHDRHARLAGLRCAVIITPHAGEMATLLGRDKEEIENQRVEAVQEAIRALRVVVVLKGTESLVGERHQLFRNFAGNPGLAISGSGDTLSGLIAGLAARGAEPLQAAVWGVHLHACAGDVLANKIGPLGYLPRELLAEIPALMARFGKTAP